MHKQYLQCSFQIAVTESVICHGGKLNRLGVASIDSCSQEEEDRCIKGFVAVTGRKGTLVRLT